MNVSRIAFGTRFVFAPPSEDKPGPKNSAISQAAQRLKTALTSQNHPENTLIHVWSPLTREVEVRLTPHPSEAGKFKREIYWWAPPEGRSTKSKETGYGSPSSQEIDAILGKASTVSDAFISTERKQDSFNNTVTGESAKYFSLLNEKAVDDFLRSLTHTFAGHFRQSETLKPSIKLPGRQN